MAKTILFASKPGNTKPKAANKPAPKTAPSKEEEEPSMTVADLMEQLEKFDKDTTVGFGILLTNEEGEDELDFYEVDSIEEIEAEDGETCIALISDLTDSEDDDEDEDDDGDDEDDEDEDED